MTGRLIVIEGGDGLGKSTQLSMLRDRIKNSGYKIVEFDFPYKCGDPISELIAEFLRGEYGDVVPEFLSLAFAVDRLAHRERMAAALREGAVVLCDRYALSNLAFQAAKLNDHGRRAKLEKLLSWIEYALFDLPRPDLEIILLAGDDHYSEGKHLTRSKMQGREYMGTAADIHESSVDLQMRVNEFFSDLPESGTRCKVSTYDAEGRRLSPEQLHQEIWREIELKFRLDASKEMRDESY